MAYMRRRSRKDQRRQMTQPPQFTPPIPRHRTAHHGTPPPALLMPGRVIRYRLKRTGQVPTIRVPIVLFFRTALGQGIG